MSMPDVGRYRYQIGASTPTVNNVNVVLADTEYPLQLPASARAVVFQCRANNAIRYAFQAGVVAGPVGAYMTLKAGAVYWKESIICVGVTLYFASAIAGQVVEVEVWT